MTTVKEKASGDAFGARRQISVWPYVAVFSVQTSREAGGARPAAQAPGPGPPRTPPRGPQSRQEGVHTRADGLPDLGPLVLCDFSHEVSLPWTSTSTLRTGNCFIIMLNRHVAWLMKVASRQHMEDRVPRKLLSSTAHIICAVIRDNL